MGQNREGPIHPVCPKTRQILLPAKKNARWRYQQVPSDLPCYRGHPSRYYRDVVEDITGVKFCVCNDPDHMKGTIYCKRCNKVCPYYEYEAEPIPDRPDDDREPLSSIR